MKRLENYDIAPRSPNISALLTLVVCCMCLVAQLCPTLCDPIDCSLLGSSVHGILQARILERVAMPSSRGSSQPRDRTRSPTLQADSLPSEPPGKHTMQKATLSIDISLFLTQDQSQVPISTYLGKLG